jgi:hypothetical protein
MRGLTSTLVLVAILAGLGAYIYFVDSKQPASTGFEAEPRTKVFSVESDKITDLTVTSSGETSVLKKDAGGWKMVEPTATDADSSEVSAITSAISGIESSRTIDENAARLAEYGLEKPSTTIEFKAEGNLSGTLLLGDKTAMQSDLYAMKGGEKKVFLVPAYQETSLAKKPFDLRDKKILKFDRDKADLLSIARGKETLELAREGTDWTMRKPYAARADYSGAEGLLTRLSTSNMTTLVESAATDLAKYGLDKPAATIVVGAGSAKTTLQVGKTEDGKTYARDASRPMVFTIDTTLEDDVKKAFDDYRRKEFFEFRPFSVQRVRAVLDQPSGPVAYDFERVKAEKPSDPDKWRVMKAGGAAHEVPEAAMNDLLQRLADLKATAYGDAKAKTGLDKPALVVSTSYDEGKFERVRFGEAGDAAYALREGETGAGKLDRSALETALKALDAAVAPPQPSPTPAPTPAATAQGARQ